MLPIQSQLRIQAHCGCVESWLQLCIMKVNLEPQSLVWNLESYTTFTFWSTLVLKPVETRLVL